MLSVMSAAATGPKPGGCLALFSPRGLKLRLFHTQALGGRKPVFAIIAAAGWPIWPLIIASIIALGIIVERAWSLQQSKIVPRNLLQEVAQEVKQKGVTQDLLNRLAQGSLLASLFRSEERRV